MSEEIWKGVPGFEDEYLVSSKGRVKTLAVPFKHRKANGEIEYRLKKEKILNLKPGNRGYVMAHIGGKGRSVHRLVAMAFLPNPDNLTDVNHIDGNKANNCVENLEWVSHKGNMEHASRTGLLANKPKRLSRYEIQKIRENYRPGKNSGYNTIDIAKKYGLSGSHVYRILSGKKCRLVQRDLSAIQDGWCVCPTCGDKLFEISKGAYIERFMFECPECGATFEVNTPVINKAVAMT